MTNITDYINEAKIMEAKKLLKSPELKIAQIHEKIGLTNRTTFLRLFKKYTGLSPADYRRVFPPK